MTNANLKKSKTHSWPPGHLNQRLLFPPLVLQVHSEIIFRLVIKPMASNYRWKCWCFLSLDWISSIHHSSFSTCVEQVCSVLCMSGTVNLQGMRMGFHFLSPPRWAASGKIYSCRLVRKGLYTPGDLYLAATGILHGIHYFLWWWWWFWRASRHWGGPLVLLFECLNADWW